MYVLVDSHPRDISVHQKYKQATYPNRVDLYLYV